MNNSLYRFSSGLFSFIPKLSVSRVKTSRLLKNHHYTLWENPFTTRKILTTISLLLLPLILFLSFHRITSLSHADTNRSYDVVIAGGGTGGVSAAVQAARQGVRVAIIEETDWLGGQMTAAGVSMMDEGMNWSTNPASAIERNSGIYADFINRIKTRYGGEQNLHKCYYGNFAVCFEPRVGREVLEQMVAETGRIDVFYRSKVTSALTSGNTVVGVVAKNNINGGNDQYNAKVVIDATEYGDVIPLTGANYRSGNSLSSTGINQNACIQSITYTAIVKRYDAGIPSTLQMTEEPPGYQAMKATFSSYVTNAAPITDWGNGTNPYANPRTWNQFLAYRGIADSTRPSDTTATTYSEAESITKTGINLPNDFPVTAQYLENPSYRAQVNCEAKLRTIQFLYYIQKDLGKNWSVADDEGFDTAYNQSQNSCANIPAAFKEIEKRLPVHPYVRESRRIVGVTTLTGNQILSQKNANTYDANSVNPVNMTTGIAVAGYNTDFHSCSSTNDLDAGDTSNSLTDKHAPFQIPFESLIPESVDGFLAAEKNFSQSRVANSATRLQPSTMLIGQAVGSLAAIAAQSNRQPRAIKAIEIQRIITIANSPISLYTFYDVGVGNAFKSSVEIASVYGIMTGNAGNFIPTEVLLRKSSAIVLTRLFSIPTNGTEDDAITQLRAYGLSSVGSNSDFGAENPLLKGHLALFIARGLKQTSASTSEAFTFLTSVGITVGCTSSICENEAVSRGQMAETVSTTIIRTSATPIPVTSLPTIIQDIPQPIPTVTPTQQPQTPSPHQLTGWQDYVTPTGSLVGWACDKANNTTPVRVDIYIDGGGFGQFIGTAQADRRGDDFATIGQICGGSGDRRYIFQLPDWIRNTGEHTIYTYAVASGDRGYITVPNSGQPFTLGNKDPFGYPDYVDTTGRALGWACDPDDFNQALHVDFYLDGPAGQGQRIGSTMANVPDEKAVGYFCGGNNSHRFAWALPAPALSGTHQLYIYALNIGTGETQLLGGGPISTSDRLQAPPGL